MNDIAEIRCIVKGKVQGVMYRDYVARHARHLAIVGSVRNLPNFTVEIIAQGYEDKLQKLLEYIRKGPFLARVSDAAVEWREPSSAFESFDIVF